MAKLTPYLFFNGNCREAMEFYKQRFGGNLEVMTYGDHQDSCPDALKSSVMHACLNSGDLVLMASDSPQEAVNAGTNVQIAVNFDSIDELNRTFQGLSEGGKVLMDLHDAFWGDRFGVLTDRFGIQWMMTSPLKR